MFTPARRIWLGFLLAVFLLLAWSWQQLRDWPIETNLLRLLPTTQNDPIAERAIQQWADTFGERALLLIGHEDSQQAVAAAHAVHTVLQKKTAFKRVTLEIELPDLATLKQPYLANRYGLLSDEDRAFLRQITASMHSANKTQTGESTMQPADALLMRRLLERVTAWMASPLGLSVAEDPFDWFGQYLLHQPWRTQNLQLKDGVLQVDYQGKTWVLLIADLQKSGFSNTTQDDVITAVDAAAELLKQRYPQAELLRTGGVFYAQAARVSAEQDMHRITWISLVGILWLLWWVFRSPRPLIYSLLSISIGLLVALNVSVYWFGTLHLITLVFGASLIGEAIDYAIQLLSTQAGELNMATQSSVAQQATHSEHAPQAWLKKLWPSLWLALLTSVMGYAVLYLTPFPALQQIAVFAMSGLLAAFLVVRWVLPTLLPAQAVTTVTAITWTQNLVNGLQRHLGKHRVGLIYLVWLAVFIPGIFLLHSNDDVRMLTERPADLLVQEEQIRQRLGMQSGSQFFLIRAQTTEQLLQREETLRDWLATQKIASDVQGLSRFVPSAQRQQENFLLLQQAGVLDATNVDRLLRKAGLEFKEPIQQSTSFSAKMTAPRFSPLTLESWLGSPQAKPYQHLWVIPQQAGVTGSGVAAMVLLIDQQRVAAEWLDDLQVAQLAGVQWIDKTAQVNQLFATFRQTSIWGLVGMLALIFLVLLRRVGYQRACFMLLPILTAQITALGVMGYCGVPLTLFAMLGLFLVLGVGINYAIFMDASREFTHVANFMGVLLSAATTLLSFGLLAFVSMPALRQFGIVLTVGILAAVLLTICTMFGRVFGTTYQNIAADA